MKSRRKRTTLPVPNDDDGVAEVLEKLVKVR